MKLLPTAPCLLLLLASAGAATREAAPTTVGETDAKASPTAADTRVPPQMNLLYPRIGQWQATIRILPGPASPRGGLDEGIMTIKKGPGGFSIVQDFQSHGSSGPLVGQSYTWWDAASRSYRSVWCDNMQGCTEFTTVLHGNSWSVELDGMVDGKKVHTIIRATMSPDHDCIHEEFANAYDGGPPRTETVSEYRRIIPGVPADRQPSCKSASDGAAR
jgi:hypothetical protein